MKISPSRFTFAIVFLFAMISNSSAQKLSMLCLGDSYTIGETVEENERFPNQLADLLRDRGFNFQQPIIIAKTGWTTDELQIAIDEESIEEKYDLVTLLIGVNNQYRGRDLENYEQEFENLLKQAIEFAGNRVNRVVVLSIPDWGATLFAEGKDRNQIAKEIDTFNEVNKAVANRYKVIYVDITPVSRNGMTDNDLVASDGLHPSGKMYGIWAAMLVPEIKEALDR